MVTIVSCYYLFNNKHPNTDYLAWIKHFSHLTKCNILVYTDKHTYPWIHPILSTNTQITILLKEFEEFYTYAYHEKWKQSHERNAYLKEYVPDWRVNPLWNQKIAFVQDAQRRCPEETWFVWCDIGYFRQKHLGDIDTEQIKQWPNLEKFNDLKTDKVYYAQVNLCIGEHIRRVLDKNVYGLPNTPIDVKQTSFAGGFFIIHSSKLAWWADTFYSRMKLYFQHDYLIQDDQMLVLDCIVSNPSHFEIICDTSGANPWFVFQRYLL